MEPDLHAQLHQVRAPFRQIYDAAYRMERMLRYSYWLRTREHAPRNLLGSWTEADVSTEIELWQSIATRRLDRPSAYSELIRRLEAEYDQSIDEALLAATSPSLAAHGLPIWNPDVEALVPATLDAFRIYESLENQPEHLGRTYKYRLVNGPALASIYLYPKQWLGIAPGIDDPRLRDAFSQSAGDMANVADVTGARLVRVHGPAAEHLSGDDGLVCTVASLLFRRDGPDGTQTDEYLSMAGFRGRYFKLRVTIPSAEPPGQPEWFNAQRFNSDLAMFLAFYGP